MHPDSLYLMRRFRDTYEDKIRGRSVLDVGSQDINGSYRSMFEELCCTYVGTDLVTGKNVDIISQEDKITCGSETFDVVVCGQALEHAHRPWELCHEMDRVLRPGGLACWIAPWSFQVHKDSLCPYDRWRILDDGMRVLMEDAGYRS